MWTAETLGFIYLFVFYFGEGGPKRRCLLVFIFQLQRVSRLRPFQRDSVVFCGFCVCVVEALVSDSHEETNVDVFPVQMLASSELNV